VWFKQPVRLRHNEESTKKNIYVYVQTLATGAAETLIRGWGDLLPTSLNLSLFEYKVPRTVFEFLI